MPQVQAPDDADARPTRRHLRSDGDGGAAAALDELFVPLTPRRRPRWPALALVAAVVAGCTWWFLRPTAPPVDVMLPRAEASMAQAVTTEGGAGESAAGTGDATQSASTDAPAVEGSGTVVVHVAGAVVRPGVVRLGDGGRVADAVAAAGGARPDADLHRVNLAAPAQDGSRIYVPAVGEAVEPAVVEPELPPGQGSGDGGSNGPRAPVDLNRATATELEALPGIGPSTAAAIVAHRDAHGSFTSVDQLLDVRGIGPAKLEQLRPLVVAGR